MDKFSREKGAVILKKVCDIKAQTDAEPIRHDLMAQGSTVPRHILQWAEPGRRAVVFISSNTSLVCLGRSWYQVQALTGGWWKIGADRTDLPLAYCGSISRLTDAVELMAAGKTAVISTVPHGADGAASVDLALNRANLPGLVKLQRICANLQMPPMVMGVSANPAYLIGQGAVGEEELPELIAKLASPDAAVRAESADDLRELGPKAERATAALVKLLDDSTGTVRISAAAALLRISPAKPDAMAILKTCLGSADPIVRRQAARAAGLAGPAAAPLAGRLAELLADSDELTRLDALEAIATLGASAATAMDAVIKLLDDPKTACDAADALGRMGAAARPANKSLARLLASENTAAQWAAVRAMSQIGGDDAKPAVQFMIRQLPQASDFDGYNMVVYLGLLGPVAKDATSAIQSSRIRHPVLRQAAMWAIEPDKSFPWQSAGRFGPGMREGDVVGSVYECLANEMGEQLKPAAPCWRRRSWTARPATCPCGHTRFWRGSRARPSRSCRRASVRMTL